MFNITNKQGSTIGHLYGTQHQIPVSEVRPLEQMVLKALESSGKLFVETDLLKELMIVNPEFKSREEMYNACIENDKTASDLNFIKHADSCNIEIHPLETTEMIQQILGPVASHLEAVDHCASKFKRTLVWCDPLPEELKKWAADYDKFLGFHTSASSPTSSIAQLNHKDLEFVMKFPFQPIDYNSLEYLTVDPVPEKDPEVLQALYDSMYTNRNVSMFNKIKDEAHNDKFFVAVGKCHLIGKSGLIELFKNDGYQVTTS